MRDKKGKKQLVLHSSDKYHLQKKIRALLPPLLTNKIPILSQKQNKDNEEKDKDAKNFNH